MREVLPAIEGDDVVLTGSLRGSRTMVIEQPDATIVVRSVQLRADSDAMPFGSASPASGD